MAPAFDPGGAGRGGLDSRGSRRARAAAATAMEHGRRRRRSTGKGDPARATEHRHDEHGGAGEGDRGHVLLSLSSAATSFPPPRTRPRRRLARPQRTPARPLAHGPLSPSPRGRGNQLPASMREPMQRLLESHFCSGEFFSSLLSAQAVVSRCGTAICWS
jgi:hypothetical protein